jgi:hypothetical protein
MEPLDARGELDHRNVRDPIRGAVRLAMEGPVKRAHALNEGLLQKMEEDAIRRIMRQQQPGFMNRRWRRYAFPIAREAMKAMGWSGEYPR